MANPLAGVKTWLYHLGDVGAKRAATIGASGADLVVVEHADYSGAKPRPYSPTDLSAMRGGDDDRLIVSYLSIGEAEDYRDYWKPAWDDKLPGFIAGANPEWPDNYKVRYWNPAWQKIVFKQVDAIVAQGFDGLYLDIIDAFAFWEEEAPRAGIDYRAEMVEFVAAIRARAEKKLKALGEDRPFAIIGQNGEELVDEPGYLKAIDGIGKEDLRFFYPNGKETSFRKVPEGWFDGSVDLLKRAIDKGVVVVVVEYMTKARQAEFAETLAAEIAWLNANDIGFYIAESRLLGQPFQQPLSGIEVGKGRDTVEGGRKADWIMGLGGADTLSGGGAGDTLFGNSGNDRLFGGAGNDVVYGGGGNDRIVGGPGKDVLSGGAARDSFVLTSVADSQTTARLRDTILDFSRKQNDRIALSRIDARKDEPGNQAFTFIGTKTFSGAEGELRVQKAKGSVFVYADVNGDAKADFAIKVAGLDAMKVGDFVV
jgi:cysteinyl-tRNA synthetase